MAISLENRQFLPSPCTYSRRCRGSPWNWVSAQGSEETRMIMMGLPDGRKSFKIGLAILIQYRRVTETPIQPHCRGIYRAMLLHRTGKNHTGEDMGQFSAEQSCPEF